MMKLATGLLLATALLVACWVEFGVAKPQSVKANIHVSVGGERELPKPSTKKPDECMPHGNLCDPAIDVCCGQDKCLRISMCLEHPCYMCLPHLTGENSAKKRVNRAP